MSSKPQIPAEFRAPQAKLPIAAKLRMRYIPERFPVPFYVAPDNIYDGSLKIPDVPPRGFWTSADVPPLKLRGMGPHDSLITRLAVASGFFDRKYLLLSPLIPYLPTGNLEEGVPVSRNLLQCEDPPHQPDGIVVEENTCVGKWPEAPYWCFF